MYLYTYTVIMQLHNGCCCCRSIDQLNRERKLQQQAAGAELRTLEDSYYNALRKNLEIDAACQSIEEEIETLEARVARLEKQQQQQEQQQAGGDVAAEPAAAAGDGPAENGVASTEGPQEFQQQDEEQQQQPADTADTEPSS